MRLPDFLLLACLGAWALPAQTTGSLEGCVYDPSGAAVAGASLRIVELQRGTERRLPTDERGRYLAPGLVPGVYQIEVSHGGFEGELRRGLELAAGRAIRVDFHLRLGEAHEKIEVTAEAPLVSVSVGDWGRSVEQRKLEDLPLNGRDLFDLSAQEPGAVVPANANKTLTTGLGVHVSINGMRPNQTAFRLDGVYVSDATGSAPTSAAGRTPGVEAVEELRLVSSPFSAEYGRTVGAVVTAVSKSGTNQLHGSLYEFLRNSALDTRNFFDPSTAKTPPLRRNQFGGLLGGPLRRDRVFLLGNYEGIRQSSSQTLHSVTPEAGTRQGRLPGPGGLQIIPVAPQVRPYLDLFPLPNGASFGDGAGEYISGNPTATREDYVAAKVNAFASERLNFASRYSLDDANSSSFDPFSLWRLGKESRHQFVLMETQFLPSPGTIHQFRASLSRIRNIEEAYALDRLPASLSFVKGQPMGAIQVVGLSDLGGTRVRLSPQRTTMNDYQVSYDLTRVHGAHTLRLGGGFDRIQFNPVADVNVVGYYRFTSLAAFLQARPQSGDVAVPGTSSVRGWRQNLFSGFVQDELRAGPRLSLTIGLRYETYSTPAEVQGRIATLRDPVRDPATTVGAPVFENPSRWDFAPRMALAWDPGGSGKTVVRAGAGIFYDLIGTTQLNIAGGSVPPFWKRVTPVNPPFPDLLAAIASTAPLNTADILDFRPPQPYMVQFQFAVERQLGRDLAAYLGYSGNRGIHLTGFLGNINPTRPDILPDGRVFFPAGAPRLNPAFDRIGMVSTQFNSFHHALLAGLTRQWRSGVRFQVNYSWAKTIDESSSGTYRDFLNSDLVPTMLNYRANRGLSDFDARHVVTANLSYRIPRPRAAVVRRVAGGWRIGALLAAHTGHPFNPRVGFDQARLGVSGSVGDIGQRPDLAVTPGRPSILGDPSRYFDPAAFALPAPGVFGNLGRNTLTGPGLIEVDLALNRMLWQTERQSVRLRVEAFNLANHPNFQVPSDLSLFNSNGQRVGSAGRISQTSTASRQIQLAVKWTF